MAAEFRPRGLLEQLAASGVDFVVIGGIAATLHGSERATFDLDICPAPDPANLDALADALVELGAALRGIDDDLPFVPDARTLAGVEILTLITRLGALDVILHPPGSPPYAQLRRRATVVDLGEAELRVAAVDDLIAMKETTGRAKDVEDVERLEAIARLRRRVGPPGEARSGE